MTWTYTGHPDTSPTASTQGLIDAVRFMIGDKIPTAPQLQDEEIQWLLNEEGSPRLAAYNAAHGLEAAYARFSDKTVGPLRIRYEQISKAYADLAASILARADQDSLAGQAPLPIGGGLTDWTIPGGPGGVSPDTDATTGQNLPGSYFTRNDPRTSPPPWSNSG